MSFFMRIRTIDSKTCWLTFLHACFSLLLRDSSRHVAYSDGFPRRPMSQTKWYTTWCFLMNSSLYGIIRAMCLA